MRTTHNMPAAMLLELADEMGILIVDEAFDMWKMSKTTTIMRVFSRNGVHAMSKAGSVVTAITLA